MAKPNIIVIMLDDMGWKDLACTGSTFYETPNIDRLASEGMIFTNAYAACPVCSPSRSSYLTGNYPVSTGVTDWIDMGNFHPICAKMVEAPYQKHITLGTPTIASILHEQGYATWHVGKWHLGGEEYYPEKFGFEKNIGGCFWGHPKHGYFSPYNHPTLPDGPDGEYLTDRLTDEAIKLIASEDDRPFYLSFCHYCVHEPIQAKEKDIAYFRAKAEKMGLSDQDAIVTGEPIPSNHSCNVERRMYQSNAEYAAMIWNLDENTGRLMDALKQYGKADNTAIIFTSDNGGLSTAEGSPTCNLPAREGKGWMYEGGTRVPFFIWYPSKIKAGSCCRTSITTPDLCPTILDLAGAAEKTPDNLDGICITPLFEGNALPERPIFWHYPHYGNQGGTPGSSVILGKYKYIEFFEDGHGELYDLETDFNELHNLVSEMPEKSKQLRTLLHGWQSDHHAKFPTLNPNYKG